MNMLLTPFLSCKGQISVHTPQMRYLAIFRLLSVGPRRSSERTKFRLHRLHTDDYSITRNTVTSRGSCGQKPGVLTSHAPCRWRPSLQSPSTLSHIRVPTKHVAPTTCRNVTYAPDSIRFSLSSFFVC